MGARAALSRSKLARPMFQSGVCMLDPKSGILRAHPFAVSSAGFVGVSTEASMTCRDVPGRNMMGGYHVNVAALLLSQLLSITTMVYCCCCQYTRPYYHRNKVHNLCCSDDRLCFSRVVASWLFLLLLAIIIAGIDLASSLSLTVPCVQLPGITTTTTAPSAEIEDLTIEHL